MPPSQQEQLMARALFEIRVLLSSHVGGVGESSPEVREAAELAYALHNYALESLRGASFSVADAGESVRRLDSRLGYSLSQRLSKGCQGAAG